MFRDEATGATRGFEFARGAGNLFLRRPVNGRRRESGEDVRPVHDLGSLRIGECYLDDFDAPQRGVRLQWRRAVAAGKLVRRPDTRRSRDIDVDVLAIVRIL